MTAGRILLIDSSTQHLPHLLQTLREHGYEIAICPLARGALLMTNDIKPSLIILDEALNDADGRDVLKALKKNERTSSIPVIVWSARTA